MDIILVICGKSTSGKDIIGRELVKLGFNKLVTYTTRDMREGEVDGISYNFLKTKDFLDRYTSDFFLEMNYFDTIDGIWFYGSSVESYQQASNKTFAILTPNVIDKLIKHNIKFTSVYIDVSDDTIFKRQIERGDKTEEARRRFYADKKDFANILELVNFTVINENKTPLEVAEEILELYEDRE